MKRKDKTREYLEIIRKTNDISDAIKRLKKIEKPNKNHKAQLLELNKELEEAMKDKDWKEKIREMYRSEIQKINWFQKWLNNSKAI